MTRDVAIGEAVHHEMWRQGVPQSRLAKKLGITQSALSRKVRGRRPFYASEVMAIARELRVPVEQLLPQDGSGGGVNSGWSKRSGSSGGETAWLLAA